jgi:hypothetical protein
VLGGGGYHIGNTARCWALETAVMLGEELPDVVPDISDVVNGSYYSDGARLSQLDFPRKWGPHPNLNTRKSLNKILSHIMTDLDDMESVPSVQFTSLPSASDRWDRIAARSSGEAYDPDKRPGGAR